MRLLSRTKYKYSARDLYRLRLVSQTSFSPEYVTPTHTKTYHILEYIDIERTGLSFQISTTRTD
jgi:hypothetical protein